MRTPRAAVLITFAGAAAALLGLAWDVANHTQYPDLFAHESVIDPLSPAHDLIALGILVAAVGAVWTIAVVVDRRLAALGLVPIVASIGWLGFTAFDPPVLAQVTADQKASADSLWSQTYAATRKYSSLGVARREGYVPYNPFGDALVHYVNPEYMRDGHILDATRVESLVYENTLRGPVLVGAMYSLEDPNVAPPDIAGSLTPWHRHDDLCFTDSGEIVGSAPYCPPGSATYFTPWMLHVWFIANRYGPFAVDPDPWSVLATEFSG